MCVCVCVCATLAKAVVTDALGPVTAIDSAALSKSIVTCVGGCVVCRFTTSIAVIFGVIRRPTVSIENQGHVLFCFVGTKNYFKTPLSWL